MRSHQKAKQIASLIASLLYIHWGINLKVMVSLSWAAGASIADIKSLLYKLILSNFIEVTYTFGELKDLLPKVRETMLWTKRQMKNQYKKRFVVIFKSHLRNRIQAEKDQI